MGLLMLGAAAWAASCPDRLPAEYAADERSSGRVILVAKIEHLLGVYDDDALIPGTCLTVTLGGTYHPATPGQPAWVESMATSGTKERRGDNRTPEGWYAVSHQNPRSMYHKSVGISYPNFDDVMRGIESGVIDNATGQRLTAAINAGKLPDQYTGLGGDIFIHGNPRGWKNDWTWGCVALRNADMDILYGLAIPGSAVLILPTLEESESAAP